MQQRLGVDLAIENETWRPAVGFEGFYEVSDKGRVRSLHAVSRGLILSQLSHTGGYKRVMLWVMGSAKQVFIHTLVLEAFVGPRPSGAQVAHADGSKDNNELDNLRWATPSENQADREKHGTGRVGKGSYQKNRFDAGQVRKMRASYEEGHSITAVAEQFGFPRTSVADVVNRRTWKGVA